MARYGDPRQQDNEVYNGRDPLYSWFEGYPGEGQTAVYVNLAYVSGHDLGALTYGHLVNALIGVNQIRHAYPELAMCCNIRIEDERKQPPLWDLGRIVLSWQRNH